MDLTKLIKLTLLTFFTALMVSCTNNVTDNKIEKKLEPNPNNKPTNQITIINETNLEILTNDEKLLLIETNIACSILNSKTQKEIGNILNNVTNISLNYQLEINTYNELASKYKDDTEFKSKLLNQIKYTCPKELLKFQTKQKDKNTQL